MTGTRDRLAALPDGHLNRASDDPLWSQLRMVIARGIDAGDLEPHTRLPSESELCDRYDVSRTVVREALSRLVTDGRVYKIKGKGTFVAKRKHDQEFVGTTIGLREELMRKGHDVRTLVLYQALEEPTDRERQALRLASDDSVVRVRRVYFVDGAPAIMVNAVLPASLVPGLERAPLESRSLYETIRQRYGLIPEHADRWLEAALPHQDEASVLGVTVGTPLISIESITITASGTPIEYYVALQRTDSTRLHIATR